MWDELLEVLSHILLCPLVSHATLHKIHASSMMLVEPHKQTHSKISIKGIHPQQSKVRLLPLIHSQKLLYKKRELTCHQRVIGRFTPASFDNSFSFQVTKQLLQPDSFSLLIFQPYQLVLFVGNTTLDLVNSTCQPYCFLRQKVTWSELGQWLQVQNTKRVKMLPMEMLPVILTVHQNHHRRITNNRCSPWRLPWQI